MSDDPEEFCNWAVGPEGPQLRLQRRLGLSLSVVAEVILGGRIGQVADLETTTVKSRASGRPTSQTKSDSAASRSPHRPAR
jgi:hypothetical protein